MVINKLNQLYKPKRVLYYMEATDANLEAFFNGNIPDGVAKYSNTFGTYDYPGVYLLKELDTKVIGIEFRKSDARINYPADLKSIELEESFFYAADIDEKIEIKREVIQNIFEQIAKDDDAHRAYSDLTIKPDANVIGIFLGFMKIRMIYEWQLTHDITQYIVNLDSNHFDKNYLFRMGFFDAITNHYNWNHIESFLEIPKDKKIGDYAFAHFDVKEFRVINEVYGHIVANRVLNNVVKALNESDFVYTSARCHNDNFAVLLKDMPDEEIYEKLGKMFESISVLEEDPNYKLYYRCGVVPMQKAMLLGNRVADAGKIAQSLGKAHNKTEIIIYTDEMHNNISWGNYIKAYLETAVNNDEFVVYLQPKFDIHKEIIKGAEALIRWNYKNKEFLSPARFIPFFEKDGSIGKIDDIVLKKVCEAIARWKKQGRPLYPISVNLSRNQLYDRNLLPHLIKIVDSYKVPHDLIDFELTESAGYDNTDHMIRLLNQMRNAGFKISMDDFGTGYSSLSLLTKMPLDTLKIDKSFVDNVCTKTERKQDITVIKHIIELAKELGFVCLAEGAETKPQVDQLRKLGCEVIQGFYYSKPVPINEYEMRYL